MAETLKDLLLAVGLLTVIALSAMAEDLSVPDPTRPPAALLEAHAPQGASAPAAAPAPRLQALRLGHGLAPSALVDGRLLRVGDRLGDARVAAISDKGVQLTSVEGGGLLLRLSPDVQRSPAAGYQP